MGRLTQRITIALFLLVCAGPMVLYAGGLSRPTSIENRRLTAFPSFAAGNVLKTSTYDQLSGYVTDRLPLRNQAIRANSWIDIHVFRRSPNPQVIVGSNGWLYFNDAVSSRCYTPQDIDAMRANWTQVAQLLAANGKQLVLLIVPHKETVYPQDLPQKLWLSSCGHRNTPLIQAGLQGLTGPGWATETTGDDRLRYYKNDTHWNSLGAAVGAQDIVDAIEPGLWDPTALVRATAADHHIGDLTVLEGLPQSEDDDLYSVRRPGVVVTASQADPLGPESLHETRTGGRLITDPVAVLHDSFGDGLRAELAPYFSDITWVKTSRPDGAPGMPAAIKRAKIVVVVLVERSAYPGSSQILRGVTQALGGAK
jgi:hypothetical protein